MIYEIVKNIVDEELGKKTYKTLYSIDKDFAKPWLIYAIQVAIDRIENTNLKYGHNDGIENGEVRYPINFLDYINMATSNSYNSATIPEIYHKPEVLNERSFSPVECRDLPQLYNNQDIITDSGDFAREIRAKKIKEIVKPPLLYPTEETSRIWMELIKKIKGVEANNYIKSILWIVIGSLPSSYLYNAEELENCLNTTINLGRYKIFVRTAYSTIESDMARVSAAILKRKGGVLVGIQHGGSFASPRYSTMRDLETETNEGYISYGNAKPYSIDQIKSGFIKFKNFHKGRVKLGIWFFLLNTPYYNLWIQDMAPHPGTMYYTRKITEAIRILPKIQRQLFIFNYRSYCRDFEIPNYIHLPWRFNYGELRTKIVRKLITPRLVVATYNGTVQLETYYQDIPTIIFYADKFTKLTDKSRELYLKMKKEGLVVEDARTLRNFLENTRNFRKWWESPRRQILISEFKKQYCAEPNKGVTVELMLWKEKKVGRIKKEETIVKDYNKL